MMNNYKHIKNQINKIFNKEILNKEERWKILSEITKDLILKRIKFRDILKAQDKKKLHSPIKRGK